MSHNWTDYIPHAHKILWLVIGILIVYKLSTVLGFLKECLSEPDTPLQQGKGSSKRLILFLLATGFVYGWIYSLHANMMLDHYVVTAIIMFLALGLAILKPEQLNTLLDKIGSLKNVIKEDDKKTDDKSITVTSKTETTTEVPIKKVD